MHKTFDVRGFCAEAIKCKPWRVWVTGYKPHTPPTHFVSCGSGNHAWKWNDWWACYSPFLHNVFRRLSVMAFSSFHSDTELPHMTFRCNIWTSLSPSLCFGKVLFLFNRLLKTSKRYAAQNIETLYIDLVIKHIPGSFQYSSSLHLISSFFWIDKKQGIKVREFFKYIFYLITFLHELAIKSKIPEIVLCIWLKTLQLHINLESERDWKFLVVGK